MNCVTPYRSESSGQRPRHPLLRFLALLLVAWESTLLAGPQVVVWDSGKRFGDVINLTERSLWKAVPTELFAFESDPAKAASDPGYYGREHRFQGDVVLENPRMSVVFHSGKGRIGIYPKTNPNLTSGSEATLLPIPTQATKLKLGDCRLVRNAADEVILEVAFRDGSPAQSSVLFTLGKTEILEVNPAKGIQGFRLETPLAYGIVPAFIGDDLIYQPTQYPTASSASLPSDSFFMGLARGGQHQWVLTWPSGPRSLKLELAETEPGSRQITAVELSAPGQRLFLAPLSAAGIWHREPLKPAHLEKDVALGWKRPFPAKWKTQLGEAGVRTSFSFRESKGQIWRGVPGSYDYPAWFQGDQAYLRLSKKVPPKGDSVIYFLEGQDTPSEIATPVDILKATLGRAAAEPILDAAGQKLRTHHRRGGDSVHRACTCGYTEAIQAVFEAGKEVEKQDYIRDALDDMTYFVEQHLERIEEYVRFAGDLTQFLRSVTGAEPEVKAYLAGLEQIAEQIPQEYQVQKENMKSLQHAAELTHRTLALTKQRNSANLAAYMELLKAWRAMGGAQDYVVAQCHTLTRKLFQEAGYGCAELPRMVPTAQEIRAKCRQVLRNPDGYEIWANY